jgi:aspartate/methionine/tyrosine aminotransferase
VLLFVSPSNPTGAVYPPGQVAEIGRWATEAGLWVITDEIYEHLVYGDARFTSMPVATPELAGQCVVLNGVARHASLTEAERPRNSCCITKSTKRKSSSYSSPGAKVR